MTGCKPQHGKRQVAEGLVTIFVDGRSLQVPEGRTLAAVLLDEGIRTLRRSTLRAEPRGLFCAMGVCFECLIRVDGVAAQRACRVRVRDGMVIELGVR